MTRTSLISDFGQMAGVTLLCILFVAVAAQAQSFQVLHSFTGGEDGAGPVGGLVMDRAGNLYGVTVAGGDDSDHCPTGGADPGCGTAFKLVHGASGWILNSLHIFEGTDGLFPSARAIFGPDGALYGVTQAGGSIPCNAGSGSCGVVFRLAPPASACKSALCPWNESTIFSFNGDDGAEPMSEVIFDQAGNIYGTTYGGGGQGDATCIYGTNGCGTAYELTRANGTWTETLLHVFPDPSQLSDGQYPFANLIFDSAGNLYGSTEEGGMYEGGTTFELSRSGSGWIESTPYSFGNGSAGSVPQGALLLASGNLIGTTSGGGAGRGGTVFQLTQNQGGWAFNLMYSLTGGGDFGPRAALTMDAAGNLYGTTVSGGAYGYGSAFKLTPSNGGWTYTSLHDFTGGEDGTYIQSNLIMDAAGNLYGVAAEGAGGNCFRGCGVVFEITP